MDTKKLENSVRVRFNHQQSRILLEEKYTAQLIITNQDSTWEVSTELIGYLKAAPKVTILLDYYNVPVKVITKELLEAARETYNNVMTAWYNEYQELSKKR